MREVLYVFSLMVTVMTLSCSCNNQKPIDDQDFHPQPPRPNPSIDVYGLILNEEDELVPDIDVIAYDSAIYYSDDSIQIKPLFETKSDYKGIYNGSYYQSSGSFKIESVEKIVIVTDDRHYNTYEPSIVTTPILYNTLLYSIVYYDHDTLVYFETPYINGIVVNNIRIYK